MLTMPPGASPYACIVGIDPGTLTLGVAKITVDLRDWSIHDSIAWTLNGAKLAGKDNWTQVIHGDRIGRIEALQCALERIFALYEPIEIASESPYFSHLHPGAYGPLVEIITAIRLAVMHYDAWQPLTMIDPPTIKNAVGAKGAAKKDVMKEKVLGLASTLKYNGPTPMEALDEHSIDALAVAFAQYKTARGFYVRT